MVFVLKESASFKTKNAPRGCTRSGGTLVMHRPKRSVDCALARLEDVARDRARRESPQADSLLFFIANRLS